MVLVVVAVVLVVLVFVVFVIVVVVVVVVVVTGILVVTGVVVQSSREVEVGCGDIATRVGATVEILIFGGWMLGLVCESGSGSGSGVAVFDASWSDSLVFWICEGVLLASVMVVVVVVGIGGEPSGVVDSGTAVSFILAGIPVGRFFLDGLAAFAVLVVRFAVLAAFFGSALCHLMASALAYLS